MKKIAILGVAETGFYTSLSAKKLGFIVDCFDDYPQKNSLYCKKLKEKNILVHSSLSEKQDYNFAIKSPGITPNSKIYKQFLKRKIEIKSEIDFIFPYLKEKILIGITGTNGKTTTTKLLNHIIPNSFACGNIGYPLSRVFFEERQEKILIIELSSFQLENSFQLKLDYSCLLNIKQDHLDRYQDFSHYKNVKIKILLLSKKSFTNKKYINSRDITVINKSNQIKLNHIKYRNNRIDIDNLGLYGEHNRDNILFSLNLISCLIDDKIIHLKDEEVIKKLKSFKALKYCLEFIYKDKFIIINDSKSTNPSSLEAAIKFINKIKTIKESYLIMGGINKNNSLAKVKRLIRKDIKKIFAYGDFGEVIKNSWNREVSIEYYKDLKEAVLNCLKTIKKNDCILFSPACSSLDQFSSYKERGLYFNKLVKRNLRKIKL